MSEELEFMKNERSESPKIKEEADALASDDDEEEEKADQEFLQKLKREERQNEILTIDQKGTKVVDTMLPEVNTHEDLKPKKKKKRKNKNDLFIDDNETGGEAKEDDIITKTIKEQKRLHKITRPNKANYDDYLDCQTQSSKAKRLIERMMEAAQKDIKALELGIPAVNKLMMKKELLQLLRLISIQEGFLQQGGCKALQKWISPYKDGNPQETTLILDMLKAIDLLPIEVGHLKDNGLGKRIRLEAKQSQDMEVKKAAQRLFNKWSSLIFESNHDYTTLRECDTQYRKFLDNKREADRWMKQQKTKNKAQIKEQLKESEESILDEVKGPKRKQMLIPSKASFDYVNRPDSKASVAGEHQIEPTSSQGILMKVLSKAKRRK